MELRDKLRSLTVGAAKDFKGELVEYMGEQFEIREPSERQRSMIQQKSAEIKMEKGEQKVETDTAELIVWSLICCTYVPGTNETVFYESDYSALLNMPASQLDPIKKIVLKYFNVDRDELEKNLKKTTEDTTSSN